MFDGGALEVTGRVSGLDLDDGPVRGGRIVDWGLGLNWYQSQTSRLMLNYIRSDLKGVGAANVVLVRYQFNP